MPRLATFVDFHRQKYSLGLYCIQCDRWGEADLQQMIASGNGHKDIVRSRFRCRDCGAIVEKQVRPPVPELGGAVAYIR
jgi:hypothetical protein